MMHNEVYLLFHYHRDKKVKGSLTTSQKFSGLNGESFHLRYVITCFITGEVTELVDMIKPPTVRSSSESK